MQSSKVFLGAMEIRIEAPDEKALIREGWKLVKLNQAAIQEGWDLKDCFPFCETGPDGNEYSGLVHIPSWKKIRFGKRKDGDWYVRAKSNEYYKGPESFGELQEPDQPAQIAQYTPQEEAPTSPIEEKLRLVREYLNVAEALGDEELNKAVGQARANVERYSGTLKNRALAIVDEFALKLSTHVEQGPDDDLPF